MTGSTSDGEAWNERVRSHDSIVQLTDSRVVEQDSKSVMQLIYNNNLRNIHMNLHLIHHAPSFYSACLVSSSTPASQNKTDLSHCSMQAIPSW